MIRGAFAAFVILMICAPPAMAGAWLREQNSVFMAFGVTMRSDTVTLETENKFYLEYGLFPRVTLGIDYNEIPGRAGHALAFFRLPLGPTNKRSRYALELGIGQHNWLGEWSPMYKATLAIGRGFESKLGNGWIGAEAAFERRTGLPEPVYKLDAVAGLSSGWKLRPLIKLETAYIPGQPFSWSITPGVMFDVGNSTWVLGIERRSAMRDTLGITFGLWRDF